MVPNVATVHFLRTLERDDMDIQRALGLGLLVVWVGLIVNPAGYVMDDLLSNRNVPLSQQNSVGGTLPSDEAAEPFQDQDSATQQYYRGSWDMNTVFPPDERADDWNISNTPGSAEIPSTMTVSNNVGLFSMQLKASPFANMSEVSIVSGQIELSDDDATFHNVVYYSGVQGAFFHDTGRMTLFSGPQGTLPDISLVERGTVVGGQQLQVPHISGEGLEGRAGTGTGTGAGTGTGGGGEGAPGTAQGSADTVPVAPTTNGDGEGDEVPRGDRGGGGGGAYLRHPVDTKTKKTEEYSDNGHLCAFQLDLRMVPTVEDGSDDDDDNEDGPAEGSSTGEEGGSGDNRSGIENGNGNRSGGLGGTSSGRDRVRGTTAWQRSHTTILHRMEGTLWSRNCDVAMHVRVDAQDVELDWMELLRNVVPYTIVMMAGICSVKTCLLFSQFEHMASQGTSSAAKVSVLCLTAQAYLDYMSCGAHFLVSIGERRSWVLSYHFLVVTMLQFNLFFNLFYFLRYARRIDGRLHAALGGSLFEFLIWMMLMGFIGDFHLRVLLWFSYWVPQIVCNAYWGTRRALRTDFVVGMSITRLLFPLFLLSEGDPNLLHADAPRLLSLPQQVAFNLIPEYLPYHTSSNLCVLLVAWTAVQVAVLLLQDRWGARFFIPARFLPPPYNYHRPLPPGLLEAARRSAGRDTRGVGGVVDVGSSEMGTSEEEGSPLLGEEDGGISGGSIDCVICLMGIDVENGDYMVAPCDHLFHMACLGEWMGQKLECPTCRGVLPLEEQE